MSYVFSKALAQNGEEKPRRQSLPPSWGSDGAPHIKVPPPVALKPKSHIPSSIPEDANGEVGVGQAPRKSSLPSVNERTRTSSSSSDKSDDMDVFGTGPKMGGAFARLQRQIEAKETHRDLYSEAYQSYKAQRSLTAHGVLPKDMREDERRKKYSLDNNNVPPILLPKPVARTAGARRQAFGKARAMTSPVSATPPVLTNGTSRAKDDVFIEQIAESIAADAEVSEFSQDHVKPDVVGDSHHSLECTTSNEPAEIADPGANERVQEAHKEQGGLVESRPDLENANCKVEKADELLLDPHQLARTDGVVDDQTTLKSISDLSLAEGDSDAHANQVCLGSSLSQGQSESNQECVEHSCGA